MMKSNASSASTITRNKGKGPQTSVARKLRRADQYASVLSPTARPGAAPAKPSTPSPDRIAAAIDAVGRLQASHEQTGERLKAMLQNLQDYLPDNGEIAGEAFAAKGSTKVEKKLLSPQKITTLLLFLLSEVETQQASKGGLFDEILALDETLLNEHLVPLLDAVFARTGLSDKAAKLYTEKPQTVVEVLPLSKAS